MRKSKTFLSDQVVVRLPSDLREAIEEAASADRRTPSALIRNVLDDWIKSRPAAGEASHAQ